MKKLLLSLAMIVMVPGLAIVPMACDGPAEERGEEFGEVGEEIGESIDETNDAIKDATN